MMKRLYVMLLMLLAVGVAAQAAIVPNGGFETMYQPGSTTVTATLDDGEWFKANGTNQGLNCELLQGGIADYSDGTTGTFVDFPGWTYEGNADVMMGGSWGGQDGGMGLGVFTGWGGLTQVTSAAAITPDTLTGTDVHVLAARVFHDGRPINLDLLDSGGNVITPDTQWEQAPGGGGSAWKNMFRTYNSLAGDVTIVFGTLDAGDETGSRAAIDNITFGAGVPEPATMLLLGLGGLALVRRKRS